MRHYVLRRILQLLPILLGISFLAFLLMHATTDDAVDLLYEKSGAVTEEIKAAKRAELGLDQPFFVQYGSWLAGAVSGNMGKSFVSQKLVFETFMDKLPATMLLMVVSMLFTLCIAVPLGVYSAVKQNTAVDYLLRFISFIGNSLPNFFTALLLIYFFALQLAWFPIMANKESWISVILPAMTLSVSMGAKYMRQIRAAVLEEMEKLYVRGARARGVKEWRILCSVLKNAGLLLITLSAMSCGSLLGGTAIVESVFMWDGVGKMAVDAILARDYPLVQAYVIWMSAIYVLVNLLADLLYHYLDPRIRLKGGTDG